MERKTRWNTNKEWQKGWGGGGREGRKKDGERGDSMGG